MLTAEITNNVYQTLLTLNQGYTLSNNGSWLLLLNKVMGLVSQLKNNELTRNDRIQLVVTLVIRFLDEKTTLSDDMLVHIKSSVEAMCLSMLDYGGELAGKQRTVVNKTPTDPELVNTPLQITQLLTDKMTALYNQTPGAADNLGLFLPQVVMLCITTVNKFGNLNNLEKRDIVVGVILAFLDKYVGPLLTTDEQRLSLMLFQNDVGYMVDLFVGIAKGKPEYNFNFRDPATQRQMFACLLRAFALFGLCFKKSQPKPHENSDWQPFVEESLLVGAATNVVESINNTGTVSEITLSVLATCENQADTQKNDNPVDNPVEAHVDNPVEAHVDNPVEPRESSPDLKIIHRELHDITEESSNQSLSDSLNSGKLPDGNDSPSNASRESMESSEV